MSKVLSAAALAAALLGGQAMAQTVADVGQPRELPPAGYTQQQYVDSRGCVFLRAGLGGAVRWVARVGADRKPLCGATPTFQQARQASAALDAPADEAVTAPTPTMTATAMPAPAVTARVPVVAPAAPMVAAQRPLPSPITAPRVAVAAPMVAPVAPLTAPAPSVPSLPVAAASGGQIACFKSAPVLQRVALSDGGSALVCTRGDGSLTGWRAPVFPGKTVVGASLSPPPNRPAASVADMGVTLDVPARTVPRVTVSAPAPLAPQPTRVVASIAVPQGYTASWKDDRLNPMRGIGTAEGQAQQDKIWTRTTPAEDVTVAQPNGLVRFLTNIVPAARTAPQSGRQAAAQAPLVTISSMSEPSAAAVATSGPSYIQVGAFGNPANAQGAAARLAAAGLPVSSQQARGLKVILAGPFASAADAAQALGAVRGAGFGDAFIR